mmetsp:Transcript_24563/g.39572  ORF Transcript_24563/g.39572 Transcript_24563/m.39572 type:complete len:112 (+) Transcript_24563:238-573(+)
MWRRRMHLRTVLKMSKMQPNRIWEEGEEEDHARAAGLQHEEKRIHWIEEAASIAGAQTASVLIRHWRIDKRLLYRIVKMLLFRIVQQSFGGGYGNEGVPQKYIMWTCLARL